LLEEGTEQNRVEKVVAVLEEEPEQQKTKPRNKEEREQEKIAEDKKGGSGGHTVAETITGQGAHGGMSYAYKTKRN
jgi:hypothetical protein